MWEVEISLPHIEFSGDLKPAALMPRPLLTSKCQKIINTEHVENSFTGQWRVSASKLFG